MALELKSSFFAFGFMQDRAGSAISLSLFSGGTARGCTEDGDYDGDAESDEEVLQLISLIDSRWSTRGLQRSTVQGDRGAS